jgi:hypothetical protein
MTEKEYMIHQLNNEIYFIPSKGSWKMGIRYEVISGDEIICIKDLCNELTFFPEKSPFL